ncbi:DUF4738 domain-containing protein [Maribacter sp. 2-571]|uniref:DUF4738 domain-containing protein n=1 Tax=Maribacter sp. 2-571 TaxID=3417569 RepID=UPI003D3297EC
MKKLFLILLTTTIFIVSCGEQKKKKKTMGKEVLKMEATDKKNDSLTIAKEENVDRKEVVIRYFPDKKDTIEFDTLISAQNLHISIQSRTLDSYVTNEFESDGKKYIDKYRDSEKHLRIWKENQIVVDTIFIKEIFGSYAGNEFLNIANLSGYWFNSVDNNSIAFFGVINKPETDLSYDFYHFFDLSTRKFRIEEHIDEEI